MTGVPNWLDFRTTEGRLIRNIPHRELRACDLDVIPLETDGDQFNEWYELIVAMATGRMDDCRQEVDDSKFQRRSVLARWLL